MLDDTVAGQDAEARRASGADTSGSIAFKEIENHIVSRHFDKSHLLLGTRDNPDSFEDKVLVYKAERWTLGAYWS